MPQRTPPAMTPDTRHFWQGTQAGELRLQRCDDCAQAYFPPRPTCPAYGSGKVQVFKASGRGRLYSYVIPDVPRPRPLRATAVIQLDEGPRMMSAIVGCEPTAQALQLDMPLQVTFEHISDDISLPLFQRG